MSPHRRTIPGVPPTAYRRLVVALCFSAVSTAGVPPARAQQPAPPEIVQFRVGFDGHYKVGHWTPVEVTFRGGSRQLTGQVELTLADGDGTSCRIVAPRPLQVIPGQSSRVVLYARFGGTTSPVTVSFNVERRTVVRQQFDPYRDETRSTFDAATPTDEQLVISVGPSIGAEELVAMRQRAKAEPIQLVRLPDTSQLPTRWYGYEAVDALIFSTSQPEVYNQLTPNSAQLEALEQWIELGGTLVLCVGAEAQTVLGPGAPLGRFAPGRLADVESLPSTTALETFSGSSTRIPLTVGSARKIQVPLLEEVRGVVLARQGGLPLVVRTARGFGQVVFVAVDLDRRPLANWKGRTAMVNRLLGGPPVNEQGDLDTPPDDQAGGYGYMYGYTDLAGQLRSALDQFRGVQVISFALVALLVFGYILLIGPVDYFLVRKVLGRMEMTWLTFPAIVLGVSVGAYGLAYWMKGDQLRVNQVDVIDLDAQSGLVRGASWLNVFSPRNESYNLSLAPKRLGGVETSQPEVLLGWLGLPGNALNSMEARGAGPGLFSRAYRFSPDLDAMAQVPIQVWSSKSFTSRWNYRADIEVSSDLTQLDNQLLEGSVTNPLDEPLKNCLLLHGRWAYELGDLQPGQSAKLVPGRHRNLANALRDFELITGQKRGDQFVLQSEAYDPSSRDVPTILKQMMFHKAAGGLEFTRLANRYQHFIDLSGLLQLDRAVLLARGDNPREATQILNNQQPMTGPDDKRWTFYRIVLPIQTER